MYESDELPQDARDAAALLASKVYYHLGEYDEALSFALNAGSAFETEGVTPGAEEYVETVICAFTLFTSMYACEACADHGRVQRRHLTGMSRHGER